MSLVPIWKSWTGFAGIEDKRRPTSKWNPTIFWIYVLINLSQPQGEEGADGRRKQYRKQRSVQSWEFEAEGDIAPPDFLVWLLIMNEVVKVSLFNFDNFIRPQSRWWSLHLLRSAPWRLMNLLYPNKLRENPYVRGNWRSIELSWKEKSGKRGSV